MYKVTKNEKMVLNAAWVIAEAFNTIIFTPPVHFLFKNLLYTISKDLNVIHEPNAIQNKY